MLSLKKCRQLLGIVDATDEELESIRNALYAFVHLIVDHEENQLGSDSKLDSVEFEERAAIVEFDGGLSREESERIAFYRTKKQVIH